MKFKLKIDKTRVIENMLDYPANNLALVLERLNTDNVLEYLKVDDGLWIIDTGIIEEKFRYIYYMTISDNNELIFYILDIPEKHQSVLLDKNTSTEDILDFINFKDEETDIIKIFDISIQNLQMSNKYVMLLFNTIYKIATEFIESKKEMRFVFFTANNSENSRVKLYNMFSRFIVKEKDYLEQIPLFLNSSIQKKKLPKTFEYITEREYLDIKQLEKSASVYLFGINHK